MNDSRKLLSLLLLTFGTAALLTGCATGRSQEESRGQTADYDSSPAAGETAADADAAASSAESEALIEGYATYPDTYSITYEAADEQGRITTLRRVRDANGNVYLQDGDEASLYLWDGHAYHLYVSDGDGGFVLSEEAVTYTEAYVENAAAFFDEYAEKGNERFIPGAAEEGTQTCLGRSCTVFTIGIGSNTSGMKCTFLVDNETGLCLSWQSEAQVAGYALENDLDTLTCVEFTTEDVPELQNWV